MDIIEYRSKLIEILNSYKENEEKIMDNIFTKYEIPIKYLEKSFNYIKKNDYFTFEDFIAISKFEKNENTQINNLKLFENSKFYYFGLNEKNKMTKTGFNFIKKNKILNELKDCRIVSYECDSDLTKIRIDYCLKVKDTQNLTKVKRKHYSIKNFFTSDQSLNSNFDNKLEICKNVTYKLFYSKN